MLKLLADLAREFVRPLTGKTLLWHRWHFDPAEAAAIKPVTASNCPDTIGNYGLLLSLLERKPQCNSIPNSINITAASIAQGFSPQFPGAAREGENGFMATHR